MFSRHLIARRGPPAGVPYNASASAFRSKTVWGCGLLYGTHSNWEPLKKSSAETSAVPSHTYIS